MSEKCQTPIKIGAAVSGPRIAGGKITDMRLLEVILKWYPETGDRSEKVLSNPPEGSFENLKRFFRTPKGSIEPFFGPHKGSIEPL